MKPYIITIARGFGSGGKEIGINLGKRLNIPCYEEEILKMASEESGIYEALFSQVDERVNWLNKLKGYSREYQVKPSDKKFTSDDNLYAIQADIIRKLAETESCIIIGKCADYILREYDNVVSFYIEAPRKDCLKSIMDKMCIDEKSAHKLITKTDKYRASYYEYYTKGGYWTNPVNYDMTLNSARVGRKQCVDIIIDYLKLKFGADRFLCN